MIRERRNKQKLIAYYNKFLQEGIIDPNVHPWVAESWQRCRQMHVPYAIMGSGVRLTKENLVERCQKHNTVISYLTGLFEETKELLNTQDLSMLLIDNEGYVLKCYSLPFFQRGIDDIRGMRVLEQDIGTSSVSVAMEHNVPFLMFGPEMWVRICHSGDGCSAPIMMGNRLHYVLTFFTMDNNNVAYDLLLNHLLTLKYALEQHLIASEKFAVGELLMNHLPAAVYWMDRDGQMKYCNDIGRQRLGNATKPQDAFMNYDHIPVQEVLTGKHLILKETTWITPNRTYDDITSIMPVQTTKDEITGTVIATMEIEELKTMVAHATTYVHRHDLYTMVGESADFLQLQHRAERISRTNRNILLQGEPGTGKQRMAHGIYQVSPRAAGPFISVKCKYLSEEQLNRELFGNSDVDMPIAGKLTLALNGTLFIDEIEKMSVETGDQLVEAINKIGPECVRLIAACDSNLKRLTDKGLFSRKLFNLLADAILRLPPLRNRRDDIEIIAKHIMSEMSAQHNTPEKKISSEALEILRNYNWPGNIKQLQEIIEKAFFRTTGNSIEAEDIKLPVSKSMEKSWKYDKNIFVSAWKSSGGNVSRLSEMLEVSRVTLYRYLYKYELLEKK